MPSSSRSFDISDLVQVWLTLRENRNAHADLKSYHEAAFAAFSKAFGIDLNTPPDSPGRFPDEDGLHGLFLQVAHAYESTRSPFASYMAGTREISAMYQRYGESLVKAVTSLRDRHLKMMVDLVSQIWAIEESRKVSKEELEACGHPGWNAPDPLDYW